MLGNLGKLCAALCALTLCLALATPDAAGEATAQRSAGYGVRVMQFNILSSLMARGGLSRASRAAHQVRRTRRGVVSFEEVAADQYRLLHSRLPGYSFYPRRKLGTFSSALQIAWKAKLYRVIRTGAIYRPFLGKPRAIPWVELKDRATQRRFFVISVHNSPGGREKERDISTHKEIRLINRLQGRQVGPVFVLGDVNERIEFCRKVAAATEQMSMDGTRKHPCPDPDGGRNDWMLGTDRGERFNDFKKVFNHISDHPMVLANVWVRPAG